jgi:membrane-bound serine protease (ClpP class)
MNTLTWKRLLLILTFAAASLHADVIRLAVDDTIQPVSQEYITRGIEKAKNDHAQAVLIELRTPGGMLDSTRSIVEKILASEVPVIVYIAPSGGYAASAGFFILQAADVAAMAPGTNTGAAHPVLGGGIKLDDVMKSKMENDAAAFMRSFVAKRGRNVEAAESAVRESKSFTEQEALDKKIIDVVARDTSDLLKQLDGREITRFNGSKQKLQLANAKIVNFDPTMREKVLSVLMNPGVTFLLFSLGMMFIYFEFNHPGGVIPGVVGVVLVLLSIFALNILPTRFAALGLIIGAFVLFALEVKFTSHGLLGLGGTVMMVIGALLLVDGPIPELRVGLITALAVSLPLSAITIFLMSIAYRAHKNKVITGEEGMVGLIGEARTALSPSGKIFVNGELWNATASAPVEAGQAVVVKRIDGLNLEVEPASTRTASSNK